MEWETAETTNSTKDFHRTVSFFEIILRHLKFNLVYHQKTAFNHPNTTITRVRQDAQKLLESQKENAMQQHSAATGSAILDTYLQFITENTFGEFH
jgi:hypothetical protein